MTTIDIEPHTISLSPTNLALLLAIADTAGELLTVLKTTYSVDKSVALLTLEQELSDLLADANPLLDAYDVFDVDTPLFMKTIPLIAALAEGRNAMQDSGK